MRQEIVSRIQEMLAARGLDAAVLSSPQNFNYAAGFTVPSHPLFPWRLTMIVIPARGEPAIVSVDMEASTISKHAGEIEMRVWREFVDDPMRHLVDLLGDLGLARATIGIETDNVSLQDGKRLASLLAGGELVPVQAELDRLRQIKTEAEIELLRELSRIADRAILDAYESVGPGASEMDIAAALTRGVYAMGAEEFKLMIVATGERSCLPNVGPTERKLETGDVCRVEIFPVRRGYHAGVCRTASVGEAPAAAVDIWSRLVEAKHHIFEMINPGASGREIYEAFAEKLKRLSLPPIAFVGHGIGVHLHEEPYLGIGMDARLEAGMVLGVEPLCYETGHGFGLQNKDMVLVTETGAELLSDIANTDRLITVG